MRDGDLPSEQPALDETTSDEPPQPSAAAKFYYRTMCAACTTPEHVSTAQRKSQQIDLDLLYAYDPFQSEVGDAEKALEVKIFDPKRLYASLTTLRFT
jgi:hypothetical protein